MKNDVNNPLDIFFKDKRDSPTPAQYFAILSVNSRYDNAMIPKDYQGIFFDNSPVKENQERVYKIIDRYIDKMSKGESLPNLYLYSSETGTGKTTTACMLINEYIRRRFIQLTKNKQKVNEKLAVFVDLNKLQSRYNLANLSKDSDDLDLIKEDIYEWSQIEFVVIDDIGVRSSSESFRSLVHTLINERITNNLTTIYTSNIHFESLHTIFDERLQDRIIDKCVELNFVGTSRRGRN